MFSKKLAITLFAFSSLFLSLKSEADEKAFPYQMKFNLPRIGVYDVGVTYENQGKCQNEQVGETYREDHLVALSTNTGFNSFYNKNGSFQVEIPQVKPDHHNLIGAAIDISTDLTLGELPCIPLWPTTKASDNLVRVQFSYDDSGFFGKRYSGEIELEYDLYSEVVCIKTTEKSEVSSLKLNCQIIKTSNNAILNRSASFIIQ